MAEPLNVVVDISHHNGNPDFAQAAAAGIVGVIHKATQGAHTNTRCLQPIVRRRSIPAFCGSNFYFPGGI